MDTAPIVRGYRRPARRSPLDHIREFTYCFEASRPAVIAERSLAEPRVGWRWDSVCWYTGGPMRVIVEEIEALVSRAGTHPIWGYAHCLRVHALAEELAREERLDYDVEILRLSALLHDIGLYRAYSLREGADHTRRSMAVATRMLRDGDFPPQATRVVLDAIEHHAPGASSGRSAEAALLKDAVALDYLGTVGLGRVFAMVGLEEDVPDLSAAVRHAMSLRRTIPDLLHFDASRARARERVFEMDRFFESLENATANLKLL